MLKLPGTLRIPAEAGIHNQRFPDVCRTAVTQRPSSEAFSPSGLAMRRLIPFIFLSLASLGQAGSVTPGNPDRTMQVFDAEGRLLSVTSYREGRKVGRHVSFWPGGGRRVEALYSGDVIEGEYRSWHANGRVAEVKHYTNGRQSGLQQAWTNQGELYLNFEVRNGRHYGLINSKPCLPVQGSM